MEENKKIEINESINEAIPNEINTLKKIDKKTRKLKRGQKWKNH